MEYNIISFNPSNSPELLMEAYLDFDDAITIELIPEQGLASRESRKKNLKLGDSTRENFVWLATKQINKKIQVLGYSRLTILNENSPAYEDNGHIAGCSVLVLSPFKRKGLGTELIKKAKFKALGFTKVTHLMFRSYNQSGYSFLEKHDAKLVLEQNLSHLKISDVDWKLINNWNSKGEEIGKKEGIKLVELDGSIPENIIEEYASLYTEVMNQQPLGSLSHRNVTTPETLRLRAEQMKKKDYFWHTLLTIEKNGQISGLTEFQYSLNKPNIITQLLTGVREKYRGRGLGKWLKASMLLFMKDRYPDANYVETSNTVTNDAMISINRRIGFKDKNPLKFYELKIK